MQKFKIFALGKRVRTATMLMTANTIFIADPGSKEKSGLATKRLVI